MPALSLCMIVRDEAEVLARCLDSVADLADEIVIVDTGSLDDTISIALRYDAKVLRYAWHDDFAAARNYSFKHATSPYILWLDADDVLPPEDREKLREWKPRLDKDVYYLLYDYLQDEYGASLCLLHRERIVRKDAGLRWHYPAHECLLIPEGVTSQDLPIRVVHRRPVERVRRDKARNLRILEAAVGDPAYRALPRVRYYLGKEYEDCGQCEAAIGAYHAFLEMDGGWVEDRFNAQLRIARCEYRLSRKDDARRSAKLARKMDPRWSEPNYLLGQLALDEEDYEEAVFWYQSCLREIPAVLSPVDTFCYRLGPLVQLCICYDRLGDHRRAWEFNQKALELWPQDPGLLYNREYLSERLSKQPARQPVRLNLGGAGRRHLDFRTCNKYPGSGVDESFPLESIPYPDASVRSIYSDHALEHLPHVEARAALREWFRVLEPGGDLVVQLPDLAACCRAFIDSTTQAERDWYRYTIYGRQNEQNDLPAAAQFHQTGFTLAELNEELQAAGFILDISGTYDGYGTPSLYARALKPAMELRVAWVGDDGYLANPQSRVRAYHIDRWLRAHACRSGIVSFEEAMNADVAVFFRRFDAAEFARMEQARNAGKRVILDLCEDLFDLPFQWYVPMIRLAHTVVCCSTELARKTAMHHSHVVTIEDAVEADFALNCAYETTNRLRIGWIGMQGNAWMAEQLRSAIEAMGHELVTIHDGADATVTWTLDGWQHALAGCDIAVVPANFRRQPAKSNNRASNAMALGLPVIASPLPAYLEFIVHGENGFLAESEEDWLNCIRILANPEVRRRIGQAGKQTARRYHLDGSGARWRALLFQPEPLVDILIPTRDNPDYLRAALDSIAACTTTPHRVVVINSGAAVSVPAEVEVLQSDRALNYSEALNLGIRSTSSPYVCFLNDDVIVTAGWLGRLLEGFTDGELRDSVAMVNPLSNCDAGWLHDYPLHVGGIPLLPGEHVLRDGTVQMRHGEPHAFSPTRLYGFASPGSRVYEQDWVAFFCTLLPRRGIETIGLLDEGFRNGCEDLDYGRRAALAGLRAAVNEKAFVFHFGSVSRGDKIVSSTGHRQADNRANDARIALKYNRPLVVFHTGYAFESWTAANVLEGGIGGAETCAALLAEALVRRGMRVVVFSPCAGREGEYGGVEYLDTSRFDGFAAMHHAHAFIVSRYAELLDAPVRASRRFLWAHDIWALEPEPTRLRQRAHSLSVIVCLSPWHKEFFANYHGVAPEQIEVIGNGIDPARFCAQVPRIPGRFIYSSSPDRGLDHLLEMFPAIREQLPGAELHVFYGFDNWEKSRKGDSQGEWRGRMEQLLRQDGVQFHGRVGQDRLAREFLQSEFWFYPTAFTETFCISALEAQMAGALCIATDLAALQTTVGPRGVLLPGDPASPQYRFAAIDAIRRPVQDPQWRERIVSDAREWAAEQSWDRIASLWLRLLER
jgi:glycosyltransferase involved in cell wall biosynthesis